MKTGGILRRHDKRGVIIGAGMNFGKFTGNATKRVDLSTVGIITGSYSLGNMTLPTLTAGLVWDTTDLFTTSGALSGTIDIVAVPEPGSLLIGVFCGLSISLRRRRAKKTA